MQFFSFLVRLSYKDNPHNEELHRDERDSHEIIIQQRSYSRQETAGVIICNKTKNPSLFAVEITLTTYAKKSVKHTSIQYVAKYNYANMKNVTNTRRKKKRQVRFYIK